MAQYRFDPIWNTYFLEEAENFSLVDGQDHTDPNAGVTGNAFDNTIIGNDADNRLDGGEGADTLEGGAGNDAYAVDNPGDVVIEAEDGGSGDSVTAYISYTLPDHVEVLILQGFENIRGTGNGLANTLLGSDGGSNLLEGLGGNDRLFGFDGDDTLDGGEGADELWGWSGNDTFIVDDPGDVVSEDENRGEDLVIASVGYTLVDHVEHLRLVGSQGLAGIGNGLDNRIAGDGGSDTLEGRDGNDTLDGGAGIDVLRGGAGDDLYRVDNTDDVVEEEDDGGIDSVETTVSYALAAFVENLVASGNAAIALTGNGLDNIIQGNAAANTLDGGAGADTLEGGDGDDVYLVDDAGDLVTEAAGEGTDWVEASVDYALGDNLENLRLVGSQSLAGRGNGLANQLIGALGNDTLEGDAGNDTLDGGAGADRLEGGVGDDLYRVDDAGDAVVELDDEGIDSVETSVSYALAAFVENLVAIGNAAIDLTGNALANTLTGNAAENVLDGGAGADTLIGGDGDDTYIVDDADTDRGRGRRRDRHRPQRNELCSRRPPRKTDRNGSRGGHPDRQRARQHPHRQHRCQHARWRSRRRSSAGRCGRRFLHHRCERQHHRACGRRHGHGSHSRVLCSRSKSRKPGRRGNGFDRPDGQRVEQQADRQRRSKRARRSRRCRHDERRRRATTPMWSTAPIRSSNRRVKASTQL